ncbi:hypothetical protein GALL_446730 [mine drainage metagenome]|uniref:Uncharacterized protein n=1 Tax=mine drainage metagenome TaxID=410659 RepID=A0A1J5PQ19_9ZZZZ
MTACCFSLGKVSPAANSIRYFDENIVPGPSKPEPASASVRTIVRGPKPNPAEALSGSRTNCADKRNACVPSLNVWPTFSPSRAVSTPSITAPGTPSFTAKASASGMAGCNGTLPTKG